MAKKKSPHFAVVHSEEDAGPRVDDLLDAATAAFAGLHMGGAYFGRQLKDVAPGQTILDQDRDTQAAIVRKSLGRLEEVESQITGFRARLEGMQVHNPHCQPGWFDLWNKRWVLNEILRNMLKRQLPLQESDLLRLLKWPIQSSNQVGNHDYPMSGLATALEYFALENEVGPQLKPTVSSLVGKLRENSRDKDARKVADRLAVVLSGGEQIHLSPGEAWSDAALADLHAMKGKTDKAWNALLLHCQSGGKAKLTAKWQQQAQPLVAAVGRDSLKEHALRWFPLVDKPRTEPLERVHAWAPDYDQLLQEPHVELLRGLVWCCGFVEDVELARALNRLALSAYRKIPGKGPRLVSLGNACVTALAIMPGKTPIGQLAVLKVKVKFGTAQKEIEKAFNAAAAREGLPRDEIEELAVPSYGLENVGSLRERFGDYQAELLVDGCSARIQWFKDGKQLKSAPAAVKKERAEEYKELQGNIKDIGTMLPAQRERVDTLFLAQKLWPFGLWRERYLDHPLVGTIARRLVWTFGSADENRIGIWHGDGLADVHGKAIEPRDDLSVSIWHPIGRPLAEILAWRGWLETHEVVQPFKQAHREVYLLTDAERNSRIYSNRFASHILRQHQYNALCLARGWKNQLRLMVDATYAPTHRLLPGWGLRAEYWVEGAGTEYGQDTNEAGVYLRLATDQVRFYLIEAPQLHAHAGGGGYGAYHQATQEPLPLEAIPPLVFSEVMRDVDLFVGVASVGNDPNWADGGPGGRYRDYWEQYSFGELSATAKTRHALLERLIPRLKIAERCNLSDRFLQVRGDLRSYKIHLGSGNILMNPNDQYLCIVAKQGGTGNEQVFLPFEGDNTLSVILSKAFMLAEDTKIKDESIMRQIKM